MTNPTQLV